MIYTCENCLFTFAADALPSSCPDCGKTTIIRRIGGQAITTAAVREATPQEKAWFAHIQEELAEEDDPSITVKLSDIIEAIEAVDDESTYRLDLVTGEIVWTNTMAMSYREQEEIIDRLMEHGFIRLPSKYERNDYGIMEDFVASLPAPERDRLSQAMRGKGAFRRFKDTVVDLGLDQDWYDWRDAAYRKIAIEWCEENEVEYTE